MDKKAEPDVLQVRNKTFGSSKIIEKEQTYSNKHKIRYKTKCTFTRSFSYVTVLIFVKISKML